MRRSWHTSRAVARFWGDSARLHVFGPVTRLRNWRKLKAFRAFLGGPEEPRVAFLLLRQRGRCRWASVAPGTWSAPSRAPRQWLPRTCASRGSRCTCPDSPARSRIARRPTSSISSPSFPVTCLHASILPPSSTSLPGHRASRTSSAWARACRPQSTTASSKRCASALAVARSCERGSCCDPVTRSRSATDHSPAYTRSSIDRAPGPVAYRFSWIFSGGRRGSSCPRRRSRRSRRVRSRALARSSITGSAAPYREEPFEGWAEL